MRGPGAADHPVVREVQRRAAEIVGLPHTHCEMLHIVKYTKGEQHRMRFDYMTEADLQHSLDAKEPLADNLFIGGQRVCTVLVYLNSLSPNEGGETEFPCMRPGGETIRVRPEVDSALVWPNVDDCGWPEQRTLHGSRPLLGGTKYVLNAWLRSEGSARVGGALGSGPP